ncbi:MAG TPA: glycogen/starch/alpha-glucan family phosphorylase, partial [Actinoplanes sp.]
MTDVKPAARTRNGTSPEDFRLCLLRNLRHQRGTTLESASRQDVYQALALTVRDRLVDRYTRTAAAHYGANPRFVYYLSAEYMLGRQLRQNLMYSGSYDIADAALRDLGLSLEELEALDVEPGLGNGGLGRLAACLLDALATADIPAVGYGIRYDFGIFNQHFERGAQVERPDDWAFYGNPWEFHAADDQQTVGFYGRTEPVDDDAGGGLRKRWVPGETVLGEPSHMLVPGHGTATVNIIRLWRARAGRQSFDLQHFGAGRYGQAVEGIVRSENITKVLYPDDSTDLGRELRLKQQYFLVSCTLRDIIRRFRLLNNDWDVFADKVVIQLNDTHPVVAIAELMRILVDENAVDWDRAWSIVRRTFAYTCHTLLPEALETWPVPLMQRLLPRHMEIIFMINHLFLQEVAKQYPGDERRLRDLSIIQEEPEQRVRMAHLAVVGSSAVNGVAELHSRLLAATTLRSFADLWPERFHNVTNGVSPRRFLALSNPRLTDLISDRLGSRSWITDLDRLAALASAGDDPAFREQWAAVKRANKVDLARYTAEATGVALDPDALCDVMIKRFHEYKRQLLKVMHVVTAFLRIKHGTTGTVVPRSVIFAGKA